MRSRSAPDPLPDLAAILARGFLRLSRTPRTGAVSSASGAESRLESVPVESPDERPVPVPRRT